MAGRLQGSCKVRRPEQIFAQFRLQSLHFAGTSFCLFLPASLFFSFLFIASFAFAQNSASTPGITSPKQLRYYQGLRDRGLYELIEMLCMRELNKPSLPQQTQVFYRIEMAKTYAAHAQMISIDEAAELWEQAFEILKRSKNTKASVASLLTVEQGFLRARQAEQIFWIAIAEPGNEVLTTQFLQTSKQAIAELAIAGQSIHQYLKRPLVSSPPENAAMALRFTKERLTETQIDQARLFVKQAEIQQNNAPVRDAAIRQARSIASPIAKRMANGFQEQTAKLLLLSAARIQKEEAELFRYYQNLNRPDNDVQIRHQAAAEVSRFLLAQNRVTEAAELILKHGRAVGSLSQELEALRLQALLKMAATVRKTGEARLADELENEVQLQLIRLEKQGETYHTWLVRRLQKRYKLELRFGPNISQKLLQSREAVRTRNWPVAQVQYAAATQLAMQESRWEILMELEKEAAGVDFQIQDYEHASQALQSTWESSPNFPEMESIHMLWIYSLGHDYKLSPSQNKLNIYREALQDHRRRYSQKTTVGEATWLLAELQFARIQVTRALDLYRIIPQTHPKYLASQLRIGQCYQWIIQRVRDLKQPILPWQNKAVEFANKILTEPVATNITQPQQAELVLMLSRILLDAHARNPAQLQRQISQVINVCQSALNDRDVDSQLQKQWRKSYQSARALQGILLASLGEVDEARKLLSNDKQSNTSAEDRLFMARQLAASRGDSPRVRLILAELLLQVTDPLKTDSVEFQKLTSQQSIEYRELRAEAFAATGQTTKAVALYEQLVAKMPRTQKYVMRLAALLEECDNEEHWKKAVTLWKDRVRREKQGTEAWLQARYHLANASFQLNRPDEARKIVQVTQLLYPNIGSQELQNRYHELAKKLQASPIK